VTDAFELATSFVACGSPSRDESELAGRITSMLDGSAHLEVTRIGDNVIARTSLGRNRRVIVAGHLDTVSTGKPEPRVEGDVLWGLGAADMKGTLAIMAGLAAELETPPVDITWIFYAREEISRSESGLIEIQEADSSLLDGDVAILGEPTNAAIEAGCQGTLRLEVILGGIKAHSARPFMGVNAIHRMAGVIQAIADADPREVPLDGVVYAEQVQVVLAEAGIGANVVPDRASLTINHRFAPDRTEAEAEAWVRSVIDPYLDVTLGDEVHLRDSAPGALPGLGDPVLARLRELSGVPVVAKVGWTDVATFGALGIPAANFGAGDPLVAHHPDEHVTRQSLVAVESALRSLLSDPELG